MLAEVADLGPVALDVAEVAREVGQGPLIDLGVEGGVQAGVGAAHELPGLVGVLNGQVHGTAKGAHEALDLVDVGVVVVVGGDKLDGAKAAASETIELVDAKHADRLPAQLLKLDPLEVGEADTRVDLATHDGVSHVHAHADHGVVRVGDACLLHEVVDHDLAEVADVPDLFADKVPDPFDLHRLLENQARGGLVKDCAEARQVDAAVLGGEHVDHGLHAHVNLASTHDLGDVGRRRGLQDGDVDALLQQPTLFLGHKEGRVVGVGIPVELESGLGRCVRHFSELPSHELSFSGSTGLFSAC
mmetsp:Transcript_17819/g.43617  ORF Transcript_17819/g.43617 Transcript_17819/m.43617 type:complete len:302 (+) Transcript_17819:395-1300(+)